jgi:hypothetical protein
MTEQTDDFREELENEDGSYPDNWTPEVGDVLVGELVEYTKGHSRYGDFWIANIRDEDTGDVLAVWLSDVVLQDLFKRKRPSPGQRVGIKRLEDDPDKQYHRYALKIDSDEKQVPDFEDASPARDKAAVNAGDGVADAVNEQHNNEGESGGGESSGPSGEYGEDYGEDDDIPF